MVDLSDEPVLGPEDRFRWASQALAAGLAVHRRRLPLRPARRTADFALPSIAVIGAGKRVGKTALSAHLASLLARDRDVVVVAMGRGGPAEPEVIERRPTVSDLVELSRSGRHAASDYLEIAAICGVPTIGCRRAGGGLAGQVFVSNVARGRAARGRARARRRRLRLERRRRSRRSRSTGACSLVGDWHDVDSHFNTYRRLVSDLVVAVELRAAAAP